MAGFEPSPPYKGPSGASFTSHTQPGRRHRSCQPAPATTKTYRRFKEPQFLDAGQAEALIARAREEGVELLGENGLLKQMTKALLERALAEELTDHLGYDIGDPAGRGSGTAATGCGPKRLVTELAASILRFSAIAPVPMNRGSCARASVAMTASTRS